MGTPHGRSRFGGTDHLATEAVVAYVDGELSVGAHQRASAHLAGCEQCTLEVHAQQQARAALRTSGDVRMPSSLLGALCRIPDAADATLRGATPGEPLAVDVSVRAGTVVFSAHSGYVAVLRPDDFDDDDPAAAARTEPPRHRRGPMGRILPFAVVAVSVVGGVLAAQPATSTTTAAAVGVTTAASVAPGTRPPSPADAGFTADQAR